MFKQSAPEEAPAAGNSKTQCFSPIEARHYGSPASPIVLIPGPADINTTQLADAKSGGK